MLKSQLFSELIAFRREREWEQFHNARNLTTALAIEIAELQEIFLWSKDNEIESRIEKHKSAIEQEVADIAILLSYLCNDLNIDLNTAVSKKIEVNRLNYPIEKSRGSSKKYDQL